MSTNKTAADMLLKLAQDLEKEAAEKTIFACSGCGGSHSMAAINDAITKFAEENPDVDTSGAKVTVNDTVSCPNCGHEMEYAPTAESEQYYVPEETEGDDDDKSEKNEDSEKDAAAINLDKAVKLLSQVGPAVRKQVRELLDKEKLTPAHDSPHSVDKHQGVDFTLEKKYELNPSEVAQVKQLEQKLKTASDFEEHEAGLAAKVIFPALMLATMAFAGGNKPKALSAFDNILNKADTFVEQGVAKGTPQLSEYNQMHIDPATGNPVVVKHTPGTTDSTSTGPSTAQAPTAPGTGHNASVEEIVKKASADPKVNLEKLSRYLA